MMLGRARGIFVTVVCALACVSCTRQVRTHSFPAVPAVMARQVRNAVDAGEGDSELRTLRRRLAAGAKDLDARVLLARRYSRMGLPDLALEHYRLAAAQFPDSAVVTLELAKTLRAMGEPGGALAAVREYLSSHPRKNWDLLSLEGILEDELGRFEAAEVAHRAALAIEPSRGALHNNLGYNLLLQGRPDSAVEEFRRAIDLDPKSEIAHNNLAAALAARDGAARRGEALSQWQRSTGAAAAHNNLAAALIERGRYTEARAELDTALRLRGDLPAALANLRLVVEMDGRLAGLPSVHARAARRRPSIWTRIFGTRSASKASVAGAQEYGYATAAQWDAAGRK